MCNEHCHAVRVTRLRVTYFFLNTTHITKGSYFFAAKKVAQKTARLWKIFANCINSFTKNSKLALAIRSGSNS